MKPSKNEGEAEEVKRRLHNLIMVKTTNYAARWLYRPLKEKLR
ncbi:hypothetical protein [Microcystis aeruginosa]|nr:hypothetical protein [Microcystis aeruginosa]MDB9412259.1 hypothetical protein [Microcystis aeruginosa CS-567/02]